MNADEGVLSTTELAILPPAEAERLAAEPDARRGVTDRVLAAIVGIFLLIELVVLFGNVLMRILTAQSLLWSQEIAEIALAALAFVGGAIAYRRGQHMSMHVVLERVSPATQTFFRALEDCLVLVVAVVGTYFSTLTAFSRWNEFSPSLGLRNTWFVLPLVLGMVLFGIFAIERLVRRPRRAAAIAVACVLILAALFFREQQLFGFSEASMLWAAFIVFAASLCIGLPIGFVLALVSFFYLYGSGSASPLAAIQTMQGSTTNFILLAIPFFILAGYLMTEGGLSFPLAEFVRTLIGHVRGGLLQVMIVTMYIFSGISGSKVADVAAVGSTMNDMLRRQGYNPAETVAVLASSAVMGETVPPSIAMLVLGSITTLSMTALFLAGLVPAAVVAVMLLLLVWVRARRPGFSHELTPASFDERRRAAIRALPAFLVPVILAAGILGGFGTPTEVSSFAVVYALVVAIVFYRSIGMGDFWRIVVDTAPMAGMILFIITAGGALSWTLTVANLPDRVYALLTSLHGSTTLFLMLTVVVLIIMGAVLEGLPALLVFGPLLLPVAAQFGVDKLQYGIVLILAMGLGSFAPPIGVGLYVTCAVCGVSMESAMRRMVPYLIVLFLALLVIAYVPWFSVALPHALHLGIGS